MLLFVLAGQIPVSRSESVPGFQMHSEDFPALPGTSSKGSNGELPCCFRSIYYHRYSMLLLLLLLSSLKRSTVCLKLGGGGGGGGGVH